MEIDLEARLEASPDTAFVLLTEPEQMNRWSGARIERLAGGDGGGAADVGALRRVTVRSAGRTTRLSEVVEVSDPPHRFVYRIYRGPPALRAHRGEITFAEDGAGTRVRWHVRFDFAVPGMGALARRVVEPELRRSLVALERVARETPAVSPKAPRRYREPDDLGALWRDAERILDAQRALADRLLARDDPKYWFARVYQYVTEGQLDHVRGGDVAHREWALRLVPRFHRYYVENLERWMGERDGECEGPWQSAFRCAESGHPERAPMRVVKGLMLGVVAHIEEDLPRALAETWLDHFRERCDYERFRADYLLMAPVFRVASDRLLAQMPKGFLPAWLRAARAALPAELQDHLLNRRTYDVPTRRLYAFERGRRLAAWRDAS